MMQQPGDIHGVHSTFTFHTAEMCKPDPHWSDALEIHTSIIQAGCLLLTLTPWAELSTKGRTEI